MFDYIRRIRDYIKTLRDSWTDTRAGKIDTIDSNIGSLNTNWDLARADKVSSMESTLTGAKTPAGNLKVATAEALIDLPVHLKTKDVNTVLHSTTPLVAGGVIETAIVDVSKYTDLKVFLYASHAGKYVADLYSRNNEPIERRGWWLEPYKLYNITEKIKSQKMKFYYENGAVAQTKFEILVEVLP